MVLVADEVVHPWPAPDVVQDDKVVAVLVVLKGRLSDGEHDLEKHLRPKEECARLPDPGAALVLLLEPLGLRKPLIEELQGLRCLISVVGLDAVSVAFLSDHRQEQGLERQALLLMTFWAGGAQLVVGVVHVCVCVWHGASFIALACSQNRKKIF